MALPKKEGYSPDIMANLECKRKLHLFIPVAHLALLVSQEGESENAMFLDCEMVEETPQTMGVNNQIAGPGSYLGSTETASFGPASTALYHVPEGSATVQLPPAAACMSVGSTSARMMNLLPLLTKRDLVEHTTYPPGCSLPYQGQHSHGSRDASRDLRTHTRAPHSCDTPLVSLTPLNNPGTARLLQPYQGILLSWDVEVMMATPWTIGTNVFTYNAGNRDKTMAQGLQKLLENLPKLALNGNSYDLVMEMARALQAHCYNLDEWGAEAVLLFMAQCYANAMMHILQQDPCPTWKEVIKMLLRYAPAILNSVEAKWHLEVGNDALPRETREVNADAGVDSDWSNLKVHMATVEPTQGIVPPEAMDITQLRTMQGTVQRGPATDKMLLELWCIPVHTSVSRSKVLIWAEVDSDNLLSVLMNKDKTNPSMMKETGSAKLVATKDSAQQDDMLTALITEPQVMHFCWHNAVMEDGIFLLPTVQGIIKHAVGTIFFVKFVLTQAIFNTSILVGHLMAVRYNANLPEASWRVNGFGYLNNLHIRIKAFRFYAISTKETPYAAYTEIL
ncbi:hypothetical protein H4S08_004880 [Coemansia sp. RSA 1365]|nr:hypothetical protein H4S08_004880 [Coemansia sp. RSA 1365]